METAERVNPVAGAARLGHLPGFSPDIRNQLDELLPVAWIADGLTRSYIAALAVGGVRMLERARPVAKCH